MATDTAGKTLSRLIENQYAQEQFGDAVRNLQSAYSRATSRKAAKAAQDKKIYNRVRRAATSATEGVTALSRNRQKPKRSKGKLLFVLAGAGAAAAIATNEQLRTQIMSIAGGGGNSSAAPSAPQAS